MARRPTVDDSRWMGEIETRLDTIIEEFKQEREGAQAHRRDLRAVITSLSESVRVLAHEVEGMKPLVADYRDDREQRKGASRYRKWLWATIAAIAATIMNVAFDFVKLFGFRPPSH